MGCGMDGMDKEMVSNEVKEFDSKIPKYQLFAKYITEDYYDCIVQLFEETTARLNKPTIPLNEVINLINANKELENDQQIVQRVLYLTDKDNDDNYDFQEYMRLHLSLRFGKQIVDKGKGSLKQHAALFVCADYNYDNYVSLAELFKFYRKSYNITDEVAKELVSRMQIRFDKQSLTMDDFVRALEDIEKFLVENCKLKFNVKKMYLDL